jgi:hypothetical protein
LMKHAMLLRQVHCGYTEGTATLFFKIQIWFKSTKISCTCGKEWYSK